MARSMTPACCQRHEPRDGAELEFKGVFTGCGIEGEPAEPVSVRYNQIVSVSPRSFVENDHARERFDPEMLFEETCDDAIICRESWTGIVRSEEGDGLPFCTTCASPAEQWDVTSFAPVEGLPDSRFSHL